jgi:uncharacterized membrane protein
LSDNLLLVISITLFAAFFFGAANVFVRAGIKQSNSNTAVFISLLVNVVVLWLITFSVNEVKIDIYSWRYFIVSGFLAPVLGRVFSFNAIDKLGMNLAVPITYSHPLISVSIAVFVLGESLTVGRSIGGLCVVLGSIFLVKTSGESKQNIDRRYFILPILAAFSFSISHVLRKVGIDLVPSPILAAAVTTLSSFFLFTLFLVVSGKIKELKGGHREYLMFTLSGLCFSVALPILYLAFQLGDVIVVTPLSNTIPLFVLLLSSLFFRKEELFTQKVIVGTLMIVLGVMVLNILK